METIFVTLICHFLFILRIVLAVVKSKKTRTASIKKKSVKTWLSGTFLIVFFLIFTSELVIQLIHPTYSILPALISHTIQISQVLTVFGQFLLILSVIALFITLKHFGNSMQFGLNPNQLSKLITAGIFKHSRNPFFVAILLHFMGIALVISNIFFISIAMAAMLTIHWFILKEEKFMLQNFNEEYIQYCNSVRRYF